MTEKKKDELTAAEIKKAAGGTGAGKLPSDPKGFGKKMGGGGGDDSGGLDRTDDQNPIGPSKR